MMRGAWLGGLILAAIFLFPSTGQTQASGTAEAVTADPLPIQMVNVPAGTFTMGRRDDGDDGAFGETDELPRHQVTFPNYQIGKYAMTNAQMADILNWARGRGFLKNENGETYTSGTIYTLGEAVLYINEPECDVQFSPAAGFSWKTRPGIGGDYSMANHPIGNVTWYGALAVCNWLSQKNGLSSCYNLSTWSLILPLRNGYRLPSEAERERAAAWDGAKHWIYGFKSDTMGGKSRCNYYDYNPNFMNPLGLSAIPYSSPVGWFNGTNVSPNGNIKTVDSPSPVGCYDMSGNVWEWCQDWYHPDYVGAPSNGSSWETQHPEFPYRVVRGVSWYEEFPRCRTADRAFGNPSRWAYTIGFRLARNGITSADQWMQYE